MYEQIDLKRECEAIEIPSGIRRVLSASSRVRISQFLGTSYTVVGDMGCMFRIDAKDADALGLIYSCEITSCENTAPEQGGKKIDVKMSMTAPGCGMGNVLKADVEGKLARLPEVKEVHVEVVFDPPWSPARMSEAAKLQLGFDLDYGKSSVTGISR